MAIKDHSLTADANYKASVEATAVMQSLIMVGGNCKGQFRRTQLAVRHDGMASHAKTENHHAQQVIFQMLGAGGQGSLSKVPAHAAACAASGVPGTASFAWCDAKQTGTPLRVGGLAEARAARTRRQRRAQKAPPDGGGDEGAAGRGAGLGGGVAGERQAGGGRG